jgi:ketosteroid isomerase-like protein
MKIAIATFALTLSMFAADTASKSEQEFNGVIESWKQAMIKGDAAALDKLYSKDLSYEHSSGMTETKAESIAHSTKPDGVVKAIEFHHPAIHIYGNTAILKSRTDLTSFNGTVNHLDLLMVWIKSGSGWQLVARHSTKVQQAESASSGR